MNLRTPGPTPLPAEVREALGRDMVDHRGPEFTAVLGEVTASLRELHRTSNDLLVFTGSGTGGLEAAVVNLFSAGETVLVVSIGYFGERFATIARAFGLNVVKLDAGPGEAADPAQVALILWGWALAQYPYLVPPDLTIRGAAAPRIMLVLVLWALVAGGLVLFPSLVYLLRVFKREHAGR